jgi:hypothetical protein
MQRMKHRVCKSCDAKLLGSARASRIGERAETCLRGRMRSPAEALQEATTTDLVRTRTSWPHNENRT